MIRKKLLVVSSTYPRWTSDPEPAFVHELSKRLTQEFEVHVLCPHAINAFTYEILDGVHVHRFRYAPENLESLVSGGGILSNLKSCRWKYFLIIPFLTGLAWKLMMLNRRVRPDILHAHWIVPQGFVLAFMSMFLKLPPMLLTSHGGDLFGVDSHVMRFIKRFTLKRFKKITVVSSAMIKKLQELGVNRERIDVIPMGIDLADLYTPDLGVNRIPNRILFVGRIVEKKGLIYLVDALSIVKKRYPAAHLFIAGRGPEEEENKIRERILNSNLTDSVVWLGSVPQANLPLLYREAAVFVAPFIVAASGDQEGLGLVALEAIGCQCPVVLGKVAAVEKFYQEVGLYPAIVNSINENDIAAAIECVFQDPESSQKLTMLLREKIYKELDWNLIFYKYKMLMQSLAP